MGKSREIKKRMKAVGNIKRITRTMQMIATAKYSASQQRAVAGKPYTETLFDLVREIAASGGSVEHPLLASDEGESRKGKTLTLVLTSERGLCGPYNGSILRTTLKYFRETEGAREGDIDLVGKKGLGVLKFNEIPIARFHTQFGDTPNYEEVQRLAQDYIDRFSAGEISVVRVIYMRYISAGKQIPEVMQLLPLPRPEGGESEQASGADYEFSPAGPELIAELLPAAIKARLFQAFNDAIVSEHIARMVAMKAATDNAGKMGKSLQRQFNRARQSQITTELTEIISGAAALE
ncbi:MAG: ATP synthase F1 subunit gamma [Planctomycetota bacterium]